MIHDILIVDDEADIRVLTSGLLEDEGYETRDAADSDSALAGIEGRPPSLVLLDIWLQGSKLDGLGILKEIKRTHPSVPVVMMSGHGTIETAVAAIKDGAYDFIEKPFQADRLILIAERAIEAARLRRENEELRARARAAGETELIGHSNMITHVRQTVERVAPGNSRVLITGPAGSGKEVVARMLHERSDRASGPFVVLNCATMEPDRVEEGLFGVEGGEGQERKVGTFETAHNGTLFLDEVSDMPLETQGKIVRVLQEQNFHRVGGASRVQVDVRVIAATTQNLTWEIETGRFRKDLFYRLNVVPIDMPPLKMRCDDVPPLAEHFMRCLAETTRRPVRTLDKDAMAVLQAYDWPGNARELKNVVERVLITMPDDADVPISADMLPAEILGNAPAPGGRDRNAEIMNLSLREAREFFEREYLLNQVERFGGNISKTAAFVDMERSALHRKLRALGFYKKG